MECAQLAQDLRGRRQLGVGVLRQRLLHPLLDVRFALPAASPAPCAGRRLPPACPRSSTYKTFQQLGHGRSGGFGALCLQPDGRCSISRKSKLRVSVGNCCSRRSFRGTPTSTRTARRISSGAARRRCCIGQRWKSSSERSSTIGATTRLRRWPDLRNVCIRTDRSFTSRRGPGCPPRPSLKRPQSPSHQPTQRFHGMMRCPPDERPCRS